MPEHDSSDHDARMNLYAKRRHQGIWWGLVGGSVVLIASTALHYYVYHSMLLINLLHTVGTMGLFFGYYHVFWKLPPAD